MSWILCIGKHSNLVVCISLVNKVTIVHKQPHHALTFPPWWLIPWETFLSWFLPFCKHFAYIWIHSFSNFFCLLSFGLHIFPLCTQRIYIAMCVTHILNLTSFSYCFSLQILYFILFPSEVHHPYCKKSNIFWGGEWAEEAMSSRQCENFKSHICILHHCTSIHILVFCVLVHSLFPSSVLYA